MRRMRGASPCPQKRGAPSGDPSRHGGEATGLRSWRGSFRHADARTRDRVALGCRGLLAPRNAFLLCGNRDGGDTPVEDDAL